MPDYDVTFEIIDRSLEEMEFISRFVQSKENIHDPVTLLIGGWAVHAHNPWYGSVDIDIITNGRTRNSLVQYLVDTRGFDRRRNFDEARFIEKRFSPTKSIIIDFGSRDHLDPFEGREEKLDYRILDGHTIVKMLGGESIAVPERAHLLVLKMKAAWDRKQRLQGGTSHDPSWETGKLLKDHADILALLDPASGGMDIDLNELGALFVQFPFLRLVLEDTKRMDNAIQWYGRMSKAKAMATITQVEMLTR